jgi:hypothetical protein
VTREIKMLLQLRKYAISEYEKLENRGNPTAMMREMDGGYILSSVINSIDDVLKPHVSFEKPKNK